MSLTTTYPGRIEIAQDYNNVVFGTCSLGDVFGSVESASVKRTADKEELKKCDGKLLAVVLTNSRFELSLKTLFTSNVEPPGLGDTIEFPLAGITGRILDIDVEWEKAGQRMLSITATSWDSLESNYGAGVAYHIDGNNSTEITSA